ncbi:MAG TPA: helix-hairpin-helix domain-containing protein [Edaphocola sp.]|nr:helix-hairpin-helix domain-containing protein [Edaphocola sp.]
MRKPKWPEYGFHLSRNSRLGIYGLLLILVLLIAVNALLPLWLGNKDNAGDKTLEEAWAQFLAKNKDSQRFAAQGATDTILFTFDPNTASKEDLRRLGLPLRTVYTWLHYREKGGRFYKKEDLRKLYTLSPNDYRRIAPYVNLSYARQFKEPDIAQIYDPGISAKRGYEADPDLLLPLNRADTSALKKLPGIGSVFACRIVRYRARLGGFYSVEQLKEVYGLPDSTFQKIAKRFTVSTKDIKKINLNRAFFKDLAHHPYLRPYAKEILQLRRQLGRFNSVEQLRQIGLINDQKYRKIAAYLSI